MEFDENFNPIDPSQRNSWDTPPPPPPEPPADRRINQTPPPPPPVEKTVQPEMPPRNNTIGLIIAIVLLAAVAIVSIAFNTNSQATVSPVSTADQGLTVTGTGEAYATPDVAKIDFAVRTEAKDLAESQKNNSEAIAKIKNEIARFNIDAKDIKTVHYSINPEYDYYPARQPRLRGYSTYHSLRITVRKLEDADAVVQTLGGAGITEISQVSFTVDDPLEVQNEAREQAIARAKEKAEQLASLSGAKLGKIISIEESSPSPDYPYPRAIDGFGGGGAEVGLEEGSISVTSTVTLTYSLR